MEDGAGSKLSFLLHVDGLQVLPTAINAHPQTPLLMVVTSSSLCCTVTGTLAKHNYTVEEKNSQS